MPPQFCSIWFPQNQSLCNVCSSPGLYEFVIPEDLPIGKMGGKVKANDRDIGENGKSTYSIIEGDDQGMFEVVTDTQTQEGILRLKKVRAWNWLEMVKVNASCSLCLWKSLTVQAMDSVWQL